MVKFLSTVALPLFYATSAVLANTEVTNKAVTCAGDSMTVTFDTNRPISLAKLVAGTSCDATAITVTDDDSLNESHSITFDPYQCAGQVVDPSDVSSYSVEVPITFSSSLSSVMDLLVKEHTFNASCGFLSSYTATFVFGNIAMDPSDEGEFEGDELSFDLVAFEDAGYTIEVDVNATLQAGNPVYLELSANAAFDPATFSFAPSGCTITEDIVGGQSYDLFDSNCANGDVDFHMSYDSATNSWKIDYVLFLFSSQQDGAYVLSCNVDLCIASDSSSDCMTMEDACSA